jgi:hypothetical protein
MIFKKACRISPYHGWVFSCPRLFGSADLYRCAVELLLNSWLPPVYVYAFAEYNGLLVQQLLPKFTAYEEQSHFTRNCFFGGLFIIISLVTAFCCF